MRDTELEEKGERAEGRGGLSLLRFIPLKWCLERTKIRPYITSMKKSAPTMAIAAAQLSVFLQLIAGVEALEGSLTSASPSLRFRGFLRHTLFFGTGPPHQHSRNTVSLPNNLSLPNQKTFTKEKIVFSYNSTIDPRHIELLWVAQRVLRNLLRRCSPSREEDAIRLPFDFIRRQ